MYNLRTLVQHYLMLRHNIRFQKAWSTCQLNLQVGSKIPIHIRFQQGRGYIVTNLSRRGEGCIFNELESIVSAIVRIASIT